MNFALLASIAAAYLIASSFEAKAQVTVNNPVKWHPGHYFLLMNFAKDNDTSLKEMYAEMDRTPILRGIQVRFLWAEIETAKGVYDFSKIDKLLSNLKTKKKRLVLQVQTKSFNPKWKLIPDYLQAPIYNGGQFAFSTYGEVVHKGYNIKLWNTEVRRRLVALFRALGKRYNSEPYFEGIGMIETAFGEPLASENVTTTQMNSFYSNLLVVHQRMREFFPNTVTMQEVNYPREILETFVGGLKNMGTMLSSPDLRLEEKGLITGIYPYYPELSGKVPVGPQVMQGNYVNTKSDLTGYQPTVHELLSFARDKLMSNYIFWTRDYDDYYLKVLNMLNEPAQKDNIPAGGLRTSCPTAFLSCIRN